MKNLVLLFFIVIFSVTITSCSSDISYDSSKETPELKAQYDQMMEDAEPVTVIEVSRKWLGEKSKYKTNMGSIIEDCYFNCTLNNNRKISFRTSQFTDSELLGAHSIIKVVLNEQGEVVRLTRANL